jgi:hypothetical protein
MAQSTTLAEMMIFGFFFLLHPVEYVYTMNSDAQPFQLCDLRAHQALCTTPLYSYWDGQGHPIDTTILTKHLCNTVMALGSSWGIQSGDISIQSQHSSSTMALLCAKVDTDMICLLGCWHLDEMLRHLHVQTFPTAAPLSAQMLHHGHFTLIPNHPLIGGEWFSKANRCGLLPGKGGVQSYLAKMSNRDPWSDPTNAVSVG